MEAGHKIFHLQIPFFLHKIKPCFIILHKFVPWELFVFLPVFFNLFYFIKTFQSNTICTICICILRQSFVCCCGIKELTLIILYWRNQPVIFSVFRLTSAVPHLNCESKNINNFGFNTFFNNLTF